MVSKYYPLFNAYTSGLQIEQYYTLKNDSIVSTYSEGISYKDEVIDFFKEHGFVEIQKETRKNSGENYEMTRFEKEEDKTMISIYRSLKKGEEYPAQLRFLYPSGGDINKLFHIEEIAQFQEKDGGKGNIYLIKDEDGSLCTVKYPLNVDEIDLVQNYGKSFEKVHDHILSRLSVKMDKGIVLLHGDPGTGKTSYIKQLCRLVKGKDIIFVPPALADVLSSPGIISFLMGKTNSILVIEDAEAVISDRTTKGSNPGVSNILNLTDGILGDCLGIQIIATFNMKREKIDPAFLRKGRLIAEHKFTALTIEETNAILRELGKKEVGVGLTLAEIYNIDSEEFKEANASGGIGFRN